MNGHRLKWYLAKAGVPQHSILVLLLFGVYINDFPQGLRCITKLFADDASLFSTITRPEISWSNLNESIPKITRWAYLWKMLFSPDITRQEQEIVFFFFKKMLEVILVYILIMHEYNDNVFKNILVVFRSKAIVFGTYWCNNEESSNRLILYVKWIFYYFVRPC